MLLTLSFLLELCEQVKEVLTPGLTQDQLNRNRTRGPRFGEGFCLLFLNVILKAPEEILMCRQS